MTEHRTDAPLKEMFDEYLAGMRCARCERETGNWNQGHYWALCQNTMTLRDFHFCCPGDCELENSE